MGKYRSLRGFLKRQERRNADSVLFSEIEDIISASLPPSAYNHRAWWANSDSHVQAAEWMSARWQVDEVSLAERRVRFIPL